MIKTGLSGQFFIASRVFFYLTIFLMPTQLGRHFWPDWAMVLGRRMDYLSPTVFLTDILILISLLFWLLSKPVTILKFFQNPVNKDGLEIKSKFITGTIFLGSIYITTNILMSLNPNVAAIKWLKLAEFFLLGIYIVKTQPRFNRIAQLFLAALSYSLLLALIQLVKSSSVGGWWWFLGERSFGLDSVGISRGEFCWIKTSGCSQYLRPYATFPHPNVLAGFVVTGFIILKSYFKIIKPNTVFRFIVYIVMFAVLVLSASRSAMAALVLSWFPIIARIRLRLIKQIYTGTAAAIIMIFFWLSAGNLIRAVNEFIVSESVWVRLNLISSSLDMYWTSPVYGIGLGNFTVALPYFLVEKYIYYLQPVHNIYLLILSELGAIGFIVFLWFTKTVFNFRYLKIWFFNPDVYPFHHALVAIYFIGLFDHYFLTLQQAQILLTVVYGLCVLENQRLKSVR